LLAFAFGMTATCFDNREPAVMRAARDTPLAAQNLGSV
jgi:hypothetical protein